MDEQARGICLQSFGALLPDILKHLDASKHPLVLFIKMRLAKAHQLPEPHRTIAQNAVQALLSTWLTEEDKQKIMTMYLMRKQRELK